MPEPKPFGEYTKLIEGENAQLVKANIFSEEYVSGLENVLEAILDDGTADFKKPDKRLWPLRADNYRTARKLLDEKVANIRPINNCKCGCAVEVEPVHAGFKLPYYEIVCSKCGAEVWAYCEQTVIERWNKK